MYLIFSLNLFFESILGIGLPIGENLARFNNCENNYNCASASVDLINNSTCNIGGKLEIIKSPHLQLYDIIQDNKTLYACNNVGSSSTFLQWISMVNTNCTAVVNNITTYFAKKCQKYTNQKISYNKTTLDIINEFIRQQIVLWCITITSVLLAVSMIVTLVIVMRRKNAQADYEQPVEPSTELK